MPPSAAALMFAAAANSSAGESESGWVAQLLREFARSQATGFVFDTIKWTLLGGLLGILLAVLACFAFSRCGWYDLKWRFARGLRWTIFTLTVVVAAILVGLAGFWSGVIGGSERVLTRSQLATEVFPRIGEAVADGMAWVQAHAHLAGNTNTQALSSRLEEFRTGKWELHAGEFLQQLEALREETVTNFLARLEQSARERTPGLKSGLGAKLLHHTLNGLGRLLVERKVTSELKNYGTNRIYIAIRDGLITEAASAGNADTLTRGEIAAFIVRDGIVPGLLKPIRSTARAQQIPLVLIALGVMVVPPVCLRLARRRSKLPPQAESVPSVQPPVSG